MSVSLSSWCDVEVYDFPAEAPKALDYSVSVNGHPIFVYDTAVGAIAMFGMSGAAEVRVTARTPFEKAVARPLSRGIKPEVREGGLEFTLQSPVHLSLELDDDIERPLFIFANPPETPPADRAAPGLRYFAPGKIYRENEIRLASGDTLYIAGGAIVQGYLRAEGAQNIRVLGPGILDASYRIEEKIDHVKFTQCTNVEVRDTLMVDSYNWTLHLFRSSDITVDNVKHVCWRANSDGIDVDACQRVQIKHCFLRNNDDCLAIKHMTTDAPRVTRDVTVEDTVFWNGVPGNAMEIGFELHGEAIENVVFRDCDIIHIERGAAFGIHNGDCAHVHDVLLDNIRVEDNRGELADLYIGLSVYSTDCPRQYRRGVPGCKRVPGNLRDLDSGDNIEQWIIPADKAEFAVNRGSISNITARNIHVLGAVLPSITIRGYDTSRTVRNITFDNIFLNEKTLSAPPHESLHACFAEKIVFAGKEISAP